MPGTRKTIHIKKSHGGLLHQDVNVPARQPIPAAKVEKALHSRDSAERKGSTGPS